MNDHSTVASKPKHFDFGAGFLLDDSALPKGGKKTSMSKGVLDGHVHTCLTAQSPSDITLKIAERIIGILRGLGLNPDWIDANTHNADQIMRAVAKLAVAQPEMIVWEKTVLQNIGREFKHHSDVLVPIVPNDIMLQARVRNDDGVLVNDGAPVPASALLLTMASNYWPTLLNSGMAEAIEFSAKYPQDGAALPVMIKTTDVSRAALELYVASTALGSDIVLDDDVSVDMLMDLLNFAHCAHEGVIPQQILDLVVPTMAAKIDGDTAIAMYQQATLYAIDTLKQATVTFLADKHSDAGALVDLVEQLETNDLGVLAKDVLAEVSIADGAIDNEVSKKLYDFLIKYEQSDKAYPLVSDLMGLMATEATLAAMESGAVAGLDFLETQHVRNVCANRLLPKLGEWYAAAGHGVGFKIQDGVLTLNSPVMGSRSDAAQAAAANINRFMAQAPNVTRIYAAGLNALPFRPTKGTKDGLGWLIRSLNEHATHLNLSGTTFTKPMDFGGFGRFDSLQHLDFSGCTELEALTGLGYGIGDLSWLDISGTKLKNMGHVLAHAKDLKHVNISGLAEFSAPHIAILTGKGCTVVQ